MTTRYGRLRTALERSIKHAKNAGLLDLDAQAALLCSARYQADMIDAEPHKTNYNDWRTFNSTCSALGFDPKKPAATAAKDDKPAAPPRNDFEDYLRKYG